MEHAAENKSHIRVGIEPEWSETKVAHWGFHLTQEV
jgi:hypothetical protein